MSRGATFDNRYRSRPQIVGIRLRHPPPLQKESRAPESPIHRPLGIPRFDADGICS
jgi:hypothetical protein